MADRLTITERSDLSLAAIMARKDIGSEVIGRALGIEMSARPRCQRAEGLMLVGTGPGAWLALANPSPADWPSPLRRSLNDIASISDQSGGYVIFQFAGPDALRLLQRGVFIDLHPAVFTPGSSAATVIAHISVILWRIDEAAAGETPAYEVALFRSYASSFRRWIDVAAAAL